MVNAPRHLRRPAPRPNPLMMATGSALPAKRRVLGALLGALLFLPKFNLIAVGGSRAGIRIDDVVIALLTLAVLLISVTEFRTILSEKANKLMLGFIGLGLFGSLFTGGNYLFPLRMLEYLMIYVIARMTISPKGLRLILGLYLVANLIACTMQLFGVVGGYSLEYGYTTMSGRYIGLTNGAWELGALVVLAFAGMVLPFREGKTKEFTFWALVAGCLLALSGARTAAMSFAILIGYLLVRLVVKGRIVLVGSLVVASLGVYTFTLVFEGQGISLGSRAADFGRGDNLEFFIDSMRNMDLKAVNDNTNRDDDAIGGAGLDVSLNQRIFIIGKLLSSYVNSGPLEWIFGMGLGHFGPSTDLGWLRIFIETGVVGFVLFIIYFVAVTRSGNTEVSVVLAGMLALNMVTLDAFIGYKIMFVYYLVLAWSMSERKSSEAFAMSRRGPFRQISGYRSP